MPKIEYIEKNFQYATMETIDQANEIIAEYMADGLTLTLRQLYYQFVARDLIANKQSEYKRLGGIISDARLAGLIDWYAIEDRTRNLRRNSRWRDPGHIIDAAAGSFRLDHWKNQEYRVEVWIEKEALVGVIADICAGLDVDYYACKGYVSQSELWAAAQRFRDYYKNGQQPILLHLGDHDPSGIDMTRDIADRYDIFLTDPGIRRLALNFDQIQEYNPPPNPAKLTDSRFNGYYNEYGRHSWELDALEPRVMRDLITTAVLEYRDERKYQATIDQQNQYLEVLDRIKNNWQNL